MGQDRTVQTGRIDSLTSKPVMRNVMSGKQPVRPHTQRSIVPPSILITWPLTHAASSESRNATREATSSGSPTRGLRMRFSAAASRSGH